MTSAQGSASAHSAPLQDTALVLAAHGDRGADKGNAWLRAHEEALAERGIFALVASGFLKGEPPIETTLKRAASSGRETLVYPLFMSDGYFLRLLRERMAALGLERAPRLLAPFGADPGLPGLMMERALAAAREARFEPKQARLLVIGHGSQVSPANAQATRHVIATLEAVGRFARIEAGFIEEPPLLPDALGADLGPTVVAGFLTGEGLHAQGDVPAAIEASGARANYTGAIGADRAVPDMILAAVAKACLTTG